MTTSSPGNTAIPITVPRLGWNMEEGIFAGWLKQDGESVRAGEALFCLERDVRAAVSRESLPAAMVMPATAIRKTIAERMVASHRATAPVTLTTTVDARNLVNLRNQFKAALLAGSDLVPAYTDFLIKLTA